MMPGDPLSEVMAALPVRGSFISRAEAATPWAVRTGGSTHPIFHAIVSGAGWILVDGEPPRAFRGGDLLVVMRGQAHTLCDSRQPRVVQGIQELPRVVGGDELPCLRCGGAGAPTAIICGTFELSPEGREFILPLLPRLLHVSGDRLPTASWLDLTLQALSGELAAQRSGAPLLRARLIDMFFIQALRAWMDATEGDRTGWLGALAEPQLRRALLFMHGSPDHGHTTEALARRAGMSRSAFFARFAGMVGEPPMSYLTRLRMYLAQVELRRADGNLAQVARRVGYTSEAAFSRAFKRHLGMAPSEWRATCEPGLG